MSSIIIFLFLFSIVLVQAGPIGDESCIAKTLNSSLPCWTGVTSPRTCKSALLNLGKTQFISCSTIGFGWWSSSTSNLTIIIETPFTQQRQPYAIYLNNQQLKPFKRYDVKIYRIIKERETELISTDDVIVQNSDSNYQVILKFQGPAIYELLPIIYEVIKS